MKTKLITALIAFSTTFGSSYFLTELFIEKRAPQVVAVAPQFDRHTQQSILKLLRQDIRNGTKRDQKVVWTEKSSDWVSFVRIMAKNADAITEYANKSGSINDADLPEDFQIAWRAHMLAWRERADFLEQTKIAAEASEFDFNGVVQAYKDQNREISRTWGEALRIARKYGAAIPNEVY